MFTHVNITKIDDVLPHIKDAKEFRVFDKGPYIAVDYVYASPDTFKTQWRRECRGIKFDRDGRIIARPLHKFFNVGEKVPASEIDLSRQHSVIHKMDGSMVHPYFDEELGRWVLMTRKGITDVSTQATERTIDKNYEKYEAFFNEMKRQGVTPIFEYISPKNKIVIEYPFSDLVLIAARTLNHGVYFSRLGIENLARQYDLSPVEAESTTRIRDIDKFEKYVKEQKGIEGYIIQFLSGEMWKIKTEEYLSKHGLIDVTKSPTKLARIILSNGIDDLYSLLSLEDKEKIESLAVWINNEINYYVNKVMLLVNQTADLSQKEFAVEHAMSFNPPQFRSVLFKVRSGNDPLTSVRDCLFKYPQLLAYRSKQVPQLLEGLE